MERDPAGAARRSRQLAIWSGGLLGAFVLIVAGLWLMGGSEASARASTTRTPDPLAARRRQAAAPEPAEQAVAPAPHRPFMDAADAAASAYSSGNYGASLQHYQSAVDANPQDAESLSNLGQVLVRLGRAEEAVPYFERAIALIPTRWAYHFNLGKAFNVLGRWDESIAAYRAAQQLFPNDYATTFNLALTLHKKGNDAAAIDEYQKAIALAPEDASFRFALALSYERLQKNAEAAAAYGEYLRLAPQAGDAERVRARISQLTGATSGQGLVP